MKNGRSLQFKPAKEYKPGDIIVPYTLIRKRIKELAKEIVKKYKNKKLLVVGILKGGYKTTSVLFEELHKAGLTDAQLSFVTLRSYGAGTEALEGPKIVHDIDLSPKGRNILLVDDILDTGRTLKLLQDIMNDRGAASVSSFVLIDKPERREVKCFATYTGFAVPNLWLQGFGMDTDEVGRADPNIIVGPFEY